VALVAVVVAAASARPAAQAAPVSLGSPCGSLTQPPTKYAHVIWIWMENHSYAKIVGPSGSKAATQSPYVNGTLIPGCGLATNYHTISHPSLPNYIAATSGSTNGITNDCAPTKCSVAVASLFAQTSWRSYQESMPTNCAKADSGTYPVDHNPAVYYSAIASQCANSDVPLGSTSSGRLASDLKSSTLPAFALVVPNSCDSTENCSIPTGDAWLKTWIPAITASSTYQAGKTAIFVTWDEGNGGSKGENCLTNLSDESCHVATLVISPYTPRGSTSSTLFTHYSLLKTTEQMLGLALLGHAADSSTQSMRAAFHL